ncbi:type II CAAX prenyl endopeptidase Rce1 family protein [Companilactobacillus mishanensis]|uniref:CPBP family glutamic-type intramembrane protease n=1 Tax=Companilactobacillus mishanensis TaxID=2486008 RepID=UPI00129765EA|nr:CPBP family intramembrane metalloprotease [Companilactobacillus mishanensis]
MNNKKFFITSYMIFWLIWFLIQTILYSYILKYDFFPNSYGFIINFLIKGVVWSSLGLILLFRFRRQLKLPMNELFNRNFPLSFWIILFAIIIYLLGSAYLHSHGLSIIKHPFTVNGSQFLGITIGAGVFEELVFRGGYMNILLTKLTTWKANFIQMLMFLLIHLPIYFVTPMNILGWVNNIATVSILGLVFGWIFARTKNLWPSIIIHCIWDTLTFLFFF